MIGALHQLVPTAVPRDAVGNHTLHLRELIRDLGAESEIFTMNVHPDLAHEVSFHTQLPADGCGLIYQFSIGSPVGDRYARHGGPRLVNYHNITPQGMLERWNGLLTAEIQLGREQLARYATVTDHAICDSEFNQSELDELGYPSTTTIPVLFDVTEDSTPDRSALGKLEAAKRRRGIQVLFVGRVAPNKAQHDLIAAMAVYTRCYDDTAHLHLVGTSSADTYWAAVEDMVDRADLGANVTLHGSVPRGELMAHYRAADVFCCVSDHEGFGVPLVEAMHHGLPVIAYRSTGVTGTVGPGGLLVDDKDPATIAAAIARVAGDAELRDRLVDAAHRRAEHFAIDRTRQHFADELARVMARF